MLIKSLDVTTSVDESIVQLVDRLLIDAVQKKASDIHFEMYDEVYRIRYRQDGLLYEIAQLPIALAQRIVARLKVMSQLNVAERRIPQDGRFRFFLAEKKPMDFRISTCPTTHGEKVVLRILDPASADIDIDSLGFEPFQRELFLRSIQKSQGMVLVTGPTGSGKTMSLYSALKILNTTEKNIFTVEDPVEIHLFGINQVHVNTKIGLYFSTVLRAFLRQDPDVIMVGEMRDAETAEIAIKAAQTGHLVLSTLHTNSAIETITRLRYLGVASYHIATSVSLIVAQRLVRKLCAACKVPAHLPEDALINIGLKEHELCDVILYAPNGCAECVAGYRGRTAIYEILPVTEPIARAIVTEEDVAFLARKMGMQSLYVSGLHKVKQGMTSLEEIKRVLA